MDMQIIGLWIGLAITLVLGLVNFLWGGGVLSRRDRVSVREAEVDTGMVLHPKGGKPYLFLTSNFKLVRTGGDQDLYLESAYIQLSKTVWGKLDKHTVLPSDNRVYLRKGCYGTEYVRLIVNEPKKFTISETFELRDSLMKIPEEEECRGEATQSTKITDNLLVRLRSKFKIVWKDGEGKEWQYRLPERWWNRFLYERLWWRIG